MMLTKEETDDDDDEARDLNGTVLGEPKHGSAPESCHKDASRKDEKPAGNHECLQEVVSGGIRLLTAPKGGAR